MTYTTEYPPFYVTVDVVALARHDGELSALVVRRGSAPFEGRWALPGGFVELDEDLGPAALRELAEETGLAGDQVRLEQLGAYGAPGRDPRHRTVSVAYLCELAEAVTPRAGSDAADAQWQPVRSLLVPERLAFDHATILGDGVERLRARPAGAD